MSKAESSGGRSWLTGRRKLAAGALSVLLLPACSAPKNNDGNTAAQDGSSAAATAEVSPYVGPKLPVVEEAVDNRDGAPVFADNAGSAVRHGEPSRIADGVAVQVDCYAPNRSGITDVNVFYHILKRDGKWGDDYVPANRMDNGVGAGPQPDLDPRVAECGPNTPGLFQK